MSFVVREAEELRFFIIIFLIGSALVFFVHREEHWRCDELLLEVFPVDRAEEWVLLHLSYSDPGSGLLVQHASK